MVIDARIEEKSFFEMTEEETKFSAEEIIFKCSAIFGCDLPQTDIFMNILSEEVVSLLIDFGFENYTLKEIILAMKFNLLYPLPSYIALDLDEVQFSGRCVNVSFISKLLKNYRAIRNQIDRKLQNEIDGY